MLGLFVTPALQPQASNADADFARIRQAGYKLHK
jgi:hypothetical protein